MSWKGCRVVPEPCLRLRVYGLWFRKGVGFRGSVKCVGFRHLLADVPEPGVGLRVEG